MSRGQDGPGLSDAELSDSELLAAHVGGDHDAFGVLVTRHRDRLWGLALRTTGDREDASDALQEALLKAHRGAALFRGESSVTTWLHRIVVNACLDRMRHERSRPADAVDADVLERSAERVTRDDRDRSDPARQAALRLDVEAALRTLPPDQRAAVVLVDVLGHDVATAAALLACPVGTVKSRCSRGRARLARLLGSHDPRPGNPPEIGTVPPAEGPSTEGTPHEDQPHEGGGRA